MHIFEGFERVLYIDGDSIINGDIYELYSSDFCGMLLAAVQDNNAVSTDTTFYFQDRKWQYFNAGVLLFNLKKIREQNIYDICREAAPVLYEKYSNRNWIWRVDQDILNFAFDGKVKPVDWKYNVMLLEQWQKLLPQPLSVSSEAITNPVIVHYTGLILRDIEELIKPILNPFWKLYYKYKKLTPLYDKEAEDRKIERYERALATLGHLPTEEYLIVWRNEAFSKISEAVSETGKKVAVWGANKYTKFLLAKLASKGIEPARIVVVDGLVENQLDKMYDYYVQDPVIIRGKSDEFFILLDMNSRKVADTVRAVAYSFGFDNTNCIWVYDELYKIGQI
jgi:hypothetical protein